MNDARDSSHNDLCHIERFSPKDLQELRHRLADASLDTFQAAEIVTSFLNGRGYGASTQETRLAIQHIEPARLTIEQMQATLERVAHVM